MTKEIEKIIKEAANKISRIKGKEYAPNASEINEMIQILLNKVNQETCKCIRFVGGNKWYTNGCKIHSNN